MIMFVIKSQNRRPGLTALMECPPAEITVRGQSENPVLVYLASLPSPQSRRAMRNALHRALRAGDITENPLDIPWQTVTYAHFQALKARLQEKGFSPASINQSLTALRSVLKEAWRLGLLSAEQYHRSADVHAVPNRRLPPGRVLGFDSLRALFTACHQDGTVAGTRDAALFGVLFGCGLRRSEAVSIDLEDLTPDRSVKIRGKGGLERICYFSAGTGTAVADWVTVRGSWNGPLFPRIRKAGQITSARLTPQSVRYILENRARIAGLTPPRPHDARRTFITSLLDRNIDILTVQKMAGHADPRTTSRYDRRDERVKKTAAESLEIPYERPRI